MHRLLAATPADAADLDAEFWVGDPGRQHVRAVMIASADGAAQAQGRAGGLSSPADVALFALLRSHCDVILAGASTVRVEGYGPDRPSAQRAEWRRAHGLSDAARIAVVTRSCAIDPLGPLFSDPGSPPIVITHHRAPPDRVAALAQRAEVIAVGQGAVDLPSALDALAERGLRRVNCEGGPTLLGQLFAAARVDQLVLTVSPNLVGGPAIRILNGDLLDPLTRLGLSVVFEEDGYLFLSYQVLPAPAAG
jgi:riboflavin biosynthesis pyrimidine reductase